jgi:hypothetical protein
MGNRCSDSEAELSDRASKVEVLASVLSGDSVDGRRISVNLGIVSLVELATAAAYDAVPAINRGLSALVEDDRRS